ncbi:MAG: hypothetical protein M1833_006531 [Piccolia ochrophora]|nr:MAG: hypothetical protein M1833_006531 [Piccolia ochrophora]
MVDRSAADELCGAQSPIEEPPSHRSHDPRNNLKRSDPFQFGSRYLSQEDDVFEFNAWDHVETDDDYKKHVENQIARQREAPVSDFDKGRFNGDPVKWWNLFYKNNTSKFFKDRKWLQQEFPILTELSHAASPPATIVEIGAGAGNAVFPILAHNQNPRLKVHAYDFSQKAVELIRTHADYEPSHLVAETWDVAGNNLPPGLVSGTVDIVLMIFVFSALSPMQWVQAIWNVHQMLKPGGEVLFRDYGRGDLAQVRFKKGRYMDENFYVRGDGTRVYFFEKDQLANIWSHVDCASKPVSLNMVTSERQSVQAHGSTTPNSADSGFDVVDLGVDRRLLVNRQRKLKMYRCWLQGRFRKKDVATGG